MPETVGCCTKYFLFSFNVLFWIIGLGLLGIGIWAWSEKGFFDNLTEISSIPIDPVLVIIVIAIVMFILSFSGCLGSLRENIFLLKFFSVCLGVIFFAELIAGILGFVYKDWFHLQFATFVNRTITAYRDDPDLQGIIDFSQEFLTCCGGDSGPPDWNNNIYFSCNANITFNGVMFTPVEACGVPFSCCIKEAVVDVVNTQCGYGVRRLSTVEQGNKIYTTSCIQSFEDWLKTNLYTVAGIFIGIALLQIIPICFAQNMISDIQAVKAGWIEECRSKSDQRFSELSSDELMILQGQISKSNVFDKGSTAIDPSGKTRPKNKTNSVTLLVAQPTSITDYAEQNYLYCNIPEHRRCWSTSATALFGPKTYSGANNMANLSSNLPKPRLNLPENDDLDIISL